MVAITDPGTSLAAQTRRQGFRYCFENPADIGGRYLALSYFGLVPMALLGVDITTLLERAHQMWVSCGPFIPAEANPGVSFDTLLGLAARQGRNRATFASAKSLDAFGTWASQLLAAGTGKAGLGRCARKSKRSRLSSISPTTFCTTVRHRHRCTVTSSKSLPKPHC